MYLIIGIVANTIGGWLLDQEWGARAIYYTRAIPPPSLSLGWFLESTWRTRSPATFHPMVPACTALPCLNPLVRWIEMLIIWLHQFIDYKDCRPPHQYEFLSSVFTVHIMINYNHSLWCVIRPEPAFVISFVMSALVSVKLPGAGDQVSGVYVSCSGSGNGRFSVELLSAEGNEESPPHCWGAPCS